MAVGANATQNGVLVVHLKRCPHQWYSSFWKVSHRHRRIPNARRNDVELVFATFGGNFSLAFQRAKERSNPSSYSKFKALRVNATQNDILGPRTRLELTCTSSCDWTLQGHRFRTSVRSVGCMHGSDVLFNGTRRSRNFHTGTEGFQMHAEMG